MKMDKLKVTLALALMMISIIDVSKAELPRPSYARTMLKVSRSLPGETEELKVRTSEGTLATLIVKRRDRTFPERQEPLEGSELNGTSTRTKEEVKKLEEAQIEQLRARLSDSDSQKGPKNVSINEKANDTDRNRVNEGSVDYGNWTPLRTDGRVVQLEEPTTEEYKNWKPLPSDQRSSRYDSIFPAGGLLLSRNFQDRSQRQSQAGDQDNEKRYMFLPHQIRSSRTNIGANLFKNRDAKNVPPEVVVRSEINVKSNPKRSPMTLDRDGTPVIHGKRVPDEPIDKIQTWRNARVINNKLIYDAQSADNLESQSTENVLEKQRFDRFFKNVNRRYGKDYEEESKNVFFEWDPNNYKNEALKAEVYEPRTDNYRSSSHKRMLHPESVSVYPVSQLYTPESQKIAPVALKPGARAPVLQYAHPELGVQPAKILKNEKRRPDNFPENQYSFTEQRQKKKYVLNDKNIVDTYTTKDYYPNHHFYGLKRPSDAPFWVKISENLKNQFSNSVEKVSQFTRPVIDPLVEATHKISQNLGLSNGKEAQDKMGTVATGGSILIPALGLMASGAALGIGAVAVGRYLDVDVLKRSDDGSGTEVEYQRALNSDPLLTENGDSLTRGYDGTVYFMEKNKDDAVSQDGLVIVEGNQKTGEVELDTKSGLQETTSRRKRSIDYLDIFQAEGNLKNLIRDKRFQRKGADSISEIVEIDLREGNIDVTEFLIPRKSDDSLKNDKSDDILVVEDDRTMENSMNGRDEKRKKRNIESDQELQDTLQNLENAEVAEVAHIDGDWTNTPCAKRLFCDVMIQRGADAVVLMEKKMAALLGLIQPGAAVQVSSHFQQVMDAVRRHDCSSFLCPQARPGNVFF